MNLVIFCAIVSLPASLAFVVKFYDVDLGQNNAISKYLPIATIISMAYKYLPATLFTNQDRNLPTPT